MSAGAPATAAFRNEAGRLGERVAMLEAALTALGELFAYPPASTTPADRQAWRETCSDRVIVAESAIDHILRPGAPIAAHVEHLRAETVRRFGISR
jgi:predicted trehalose synthase